MATLGGLRRHAVAAARAGVCVLAACAAWGCASSGSLSRHASPPTATPSSGTVALTLESWDPRLSSALGALVGGATPERYYRVALEYRRLGVLDMAYTYLAKAVGADSTYAPAYDGMARIWRDWGFANQGLLDAHRAVYFAPQSAAAANTLGTLLQAIGQLDDARHWYERATTLDSQARYALNNLCYVAILQRDERAVAACQRAQEAAPESPTASNNLALAYAARGDLVRARQTFDRADDPAAADYNMGILYLATRAYPQAAGAFADALTENPRFALAAERARQVQARVADKEDGHGRD